VKKCASCSKDLPEAALHCVFCGAKQAPVPAAAPSPHAKTAFGYSANEVMQQLGNQAPQAQPQHEQPRAQRPSQVPGYEAPRAQRPSQAPGYGNPPASLDVDAATVLVPQSGGPAGNFNAQPAYAATDYNPQPGGYGGAPQSPAYAAPQNQGYSPPQNQGYAAPQNQGYAPPQNQGYVPPQNQGYGAPQNQGYGYGAPQNQGYGGPAPMGTGPMGGGMGIHSPPQPTPNPLPQAYLGSTRGAHAGRPIEPWKDSLKFMMLVWGAVALATFATPAHVDPMGFMWDVIIHAPGKLKIIPLIWAAAGVLSIACALIPMESLPRGVVAGVLGLAGILSPIFVMGAMPPWQVLVPMIGTLALIPGLFLRHEYTESIVPRVMVTVGVIFVLVPYLIPESGHIPLVDLFKGVIEAPGEAKVMYLLEVVKIVLVCMTLLAWMPGPATGMGKIFAWSLILFPVVVFVVTLLIGGHIGDIASKSPAKLVAWAPAAVYSVLVGYGLATVIGKQLE
jgi:hypothetical protein